MIRWSPMSSVFSIEPEGITRACPMVPLISRNASATQNHASASLRTFWPVVSGSFWSAPCFSFFTGLSLREVCRVCLRSRKLRPASDVLRRAMDHRLKNVEQPPPANFAGMQQSIGVGEKALADFAGVPRFRRGIERHVDHHRRADDIVARHAAPEAAVVGILAVVAHGEIA